MPPLSASSRKGAQASSPLNELRGFLSRRAAGAPLPGAAHRASSSLPILGHARVLKVAPRPSRSPVYLSYFGLVVRRSAWRRSSMTIIGNPIFAGLAALAWLLLVALAIGVLVEFARAAGRGSASPASGLSAGGHWLRRCALRASRPPAARSCAGAGRGGAPASLPPPKCARISASATAASGR